MKHIWPVLLHGFQEILTMKNININEKQHCILHKHAKALATWPHVLHQEWEGKAQVDAGSFGRIMCKVMGTTG